MSELGEAAFPPHWEIPPREAYRQKVPTGTQIANAMRQHWPADWVANLYLEKVRRLLKWDLAYSGYSDWPGIAYGNLSMVGPEHRLMAEFLLDFDPTLNDEDRSALRIIAGIDTLTPPSNE